MADDDKELFESALTDEQPEPIEAQPEPEAQEPEGQPRGEHGRFAPKAKEPEAEPQPEPEKAQEQPQPEQQRPETKSEGIPSWRLKEEAEARRAAEERARQYERDMAELRQQLVQIQQQNKQPEKALDIFEDPNAFVDHGVRTAIDPVKQEISQLREFYSQRDAIREHGAEKVKAAYDAMDQALRSRDPEAHAVFQRAKQSLDPYGDIVKWHMKSTVFNQIGSDPNAWLEKQLEERLKDPQYQAKLLERIRGNVQPQQRPITQLPPSLGKVASSAPSDGEEDDSDAGLLKSALRR
jgi:hypothetical protein